MKRSTTGVLFGAIAALPLLLLAPATLKTAQAASPSNQITPVAQRVIPVNGYRHYRGDGDWDDDGGYYHRYYPYRYQYYPRYGGDWYYGRPYRYYGPRRFYGYYPGGSVRVGPLWFGW